MANATADRALDVYGKGGRNILIGVGVTAQLYRGTMVSQLAADGGAVATSTALSGKAVGVATHAQLGGAAVGDKRIEIETDRVFLFDNAAAANNCDETLELFSVVYAEDDHTISDNDQVASLEQAGLFMGLEPDGQVRVYIGPAA